MPKRFCRHCGQLIPPKEKPGTEYRKLAPYIVEQIYVSPYRRSWLAEQYKIPLKQVTLIKRARTQEEAVHEHGYQP
jgi:hypothetical protein